MSKVIKMRSEWVITVMLAGIIGFSTVLISAPVMAKSPPKSCTITSSQDPLKKRVRGSVRVVTEFFNIETDRNQGCQERWTFDVKKAPKVDLEAPLILTGSPRKGFVIEGNGVVLNAAKIEEGCALVLDGQTRNVTIKDLTITGKEGNPVDGICIKTRDNKLEHVNVNNMGGNGIVINELGNQITRSVITNNVGYGIYSTVQPGDANQVSVDLATAVVNNNISSAGADHGDRLEGQQIKVEGDQTEYLVSWAGNAITGFTITNVEVLFGGEKDDGTNETILLFYRKNPSSTASGDLTEVIKQNLIGYIPMDPNFNTDNIPEELKHLLLDGTPNGFAGFNNIDLGNESTIYIRAVRTANTLYSTTGTIILTGGGDQSYRMGDGRELSASDCAQGACGNGGGNFDAGAVSASGDINGNLIQQLMTMELPMLVRICLILIAISSLIQARLINFRLILTMMEYLMG